jgi:cytochrome c oxidase subunit 1
MVIFVCSGLFMRILTELFNYFLDLMRRLRRDLITRNFNFSNLLNFFSKAIITTDHKLIGQLYISFGAFSAIIGTYFSYIIRAQLMYSDMSGPLLDNVSLYNSIVTLHGIIMIFMFVMPVLIGGFGNFFLPIMVGAPEMAFPRLNNMSF